MRRHQLQREVVACASKARASRQRLQHSITLGGYRLLLRISLWTFVATGFVQGIRRCAPTSNLAMMQTRQLHWLLPTISWLVNQLTPAYISGPFSVSN